MGGRQIRGHTFIPAPTEASNTTGSPIAAYVTRLQTAITNLVLATTPALEVYSVTHRQDELVISGVASPQWAVLRSRRDT